MLSVLLIFLSNTAPALLQPKMGFVEIDFTPLPQMGNGVCSIKITVTTTDKDINCSLPTNFTLGAEAETVCMAITIALEREKWQVEIIDKTKLRIYGRIFNNKLIPVAKGTVESTDLRPEELPKVTVVGKKG